jgi:hypothetical protein
MSKKAYTFDNGRSGSDAAVSRINKYMISQGLESRGGRIESTASIEKFSDHSPLLISIWGQATDPINPSYYFDTSLLEEAEAKAELLQAWSGDLPTPSNDQDWTPWLEAAIGRVMACNNRLAKAKKRLRGAMIRMNTKRVQLAEAQLQNNPTNEEVRGVLSDSQAKLAKKFQNQMARNQHLSSLNWFRYGDTCSKTFFDFHQAGQKKTPMRELVTDNGPIRRQTNLTNHITDFYTKLYTSEAHLLGTQEAQAFCWDNVPARVSAKTNASLTQSLMLEEVVKAILALPKNKTPGQDRIPIEFFQSCVNEVALSLLMAYTAMLNLGEASAFINRGLITLIPKIGDRSKLGNWRPITLLGCIYKILAKALARRLQTFLPSIIRPNQTGFVEGRSILHNVFMAQDSLSWAEESNQELVLLLLDFEKAFDRIEWKFLFSAMDHIGFSNT